MRGACPVSWREGGGSREIRGQSMPIFRPFDSTSQLKCDDDDAALIGIRFAKDAPM
jgi:hypothetical protein